MLLVLVASDDDDNDDGDGDGIKRAMFLRTTFSVVPIPFR